MDDESFGAGDVVPDSEGEEDRLLTPPPKLAMLEPERRKSDNFFSSSCDSLIQSNSDRVLNHSRVLPTADSSISQFTSVIPESAATIQRLSSISQFTSLDIAGPSKVPDEPKQRPRPRPRPRTTNPTNASTSSSSLFPPPATGESLPMETDISRWSSGTHSNARTSSNARAVPSTKSDVIEISSSSDSDSHSKPRTVHRPKSPKNAPRARASDPAHIAPINAQSSATSHVRTSSNGVTVSAAKIKDRRIESSDSDDDPMRLPSRKSIPASTASNDVPKTKQKPAKEKKEKENKVGVVKKRTSKKDEEYKSKEFIEDSEDETMLAETSKKPAAVSPRQPALDESDSEVIVVPRRSKKRKSGDDDLSPRPNKKTPRRITSPELDAEKDDDFDAAPANAKPKPKATKKTPKKNVESDEGSDWDGEEKPKTKAKPKVKPKAKPQPSTTGKQAKGAGENIGPNEGGAMQQDSAAKPKAKPKPKIKSAATGKEAKSIEDNGGLDDMDQDVAPKVDKSEKPKTTRDIKGKGKAVIEEPEYQPAEDVDPGSPPKTKTNRRVLSDDEDVEFEDGAKENVPPPTKPTHSKQVLKPPKSPCAQQHGAMNHKPGCHHTSKAPRPEIQYKNPNKPLSELLRMTGSTLPRRKSVGLSRKVPIAPLHPNRITPPPPPPPIPRKKVKKVEEDENEDEGEKNITREVDSEGEPIAQNKVDWSD